MSTRFHIAHTTAGRTRLKADDVDALSRDALDSLSTALEGLSCVDRVEPRPRSGSIVLKHPRSAHDEVISAIGKAGINLTAGATDVQGERTASRRTPLTDLSAPPWFDPTTASVLLAAVLLVLALRQASRGQIMVPAVSLVWYAFELMRRR